MRYFLTRAQPPVSRILLVESGSRYLFEELIPGIRATWGEEVPMDLVTCYAGLPRGFDPGDHPRLPGIRLPAATPAAAACTRELAANGYTVLGVICSDEAIMTKWKWALAAAASG